MSGMVQFVVPATSCRSSRPGAGAASSEAAGSVARDVVHKAAATTTGQNECGNNLAAC